MDDYALVLNAGSSSLKFCVFVRPSGESWKLASRGQIDGIGSSPRISARNSAGERLVDDQLDTSIRDQRSALGVLAGVAQIQVYGRACPRCRSSCGARRRAIHGSNDSYTSGSR